jgi:hypothetical protein
MSRYPSEPGSSHLPGFRNQNERDAYFVKISVQKENLCRCSQRAVHGIRHLGKQMLNIVGVVLDIISNLTSFWVIVRRKWIVLHSPAMERFHCGQSANASDPLNFKGSCLPEDYSY